MAAASFGALGLAHAWYIMGKAALPPSWRLICAITITIALGYPCHKVYEQSLSLFLTFSVFIVLRQPSSFKRWMALGVATGLAAIFGRNHGVFFIIATALCAGYVFITKKKRGFSKIFMGYSLGVLLVYGPMVFLLVTKPGFWIKFWESLWFTVHWQLPLPIPFFWKLDFTAPLTFEFFHALAIGIACVLIPAIYLLGLVLFLIKTLYA